MSYVYQQTEPRLWTVGYYAPKGDWVAARDYDCEEDAAEAVRLLNGGMRAQFEPATKPEAPQAFAQWCIVELLGHRRLAGLITEVQLAGAGFLRLDIPKTDRGPARTQYVAPASVYALHPVDETTATRVATTCYPDPVHRWELPAAPPRDDDEDQAAFDGDGF